MTYNIFKSSKSTAFCDNTHCPRKLSTTV